MSAPLSLSLRTTIDDSVEVGVVSRSARQLYFARYDGRLYVAAPAHDQTPQLIAADGHTVLAPTLPGASMHDALLRVIDGGGAASVPMLFVEPGGKLRLRLSVRNPPADGFLEQDLLFYELASQP